MRGLGGVPQRSDARVGAVAIGRAGWPDGSVYGLLANDAWRFPWDVERVGTVPSSSADGNRSRSRRISLFELQGRFGNFGCASECASGGGTSRIATAVTCPMTSASPG